MKGGRGSNICYHTHPDKQHTHTVWTGKLLPSAHSKRILCPFFFNQNHAKQREEHKKLLPFALAKKKKKKEVIRHGGNKLTMKL